MISNWREHLRQRLEGIDARGGPPPQGVEIVIPAEELRVADHDVFLAHAGRLNDAPFLGAPTGTIEIGFAAGWERHPQLRFVYRPEPPDGFRPGRERDRAADDRGDAFGRITGVDFNELP